jgi:hypothetical protein
MGDVFNPLCTFVWLCVPFLLYLGIIKKYNIMERLEMLRGMFVKYGNGVFVMRMDDKDRFRICRVNGRVNWVKCKKILNDNNISFIEGHDGYGMMLGRCIDFDFKGV